MTVLESCNKGSEVTLYYNVGDADTPVWIEHIGMIEDLDVNETEELNELTGRRTSRLVKEYNQGEIELSITGTQITSPEYEGWKFLNSMRTGGVSREVCVLTGKIGKVGSYGWRGDFWNSDRTTRGPATGNMTSAVNLQPAAPCHADHSPVRVVKIASAGVTGDFDPTDFTSEYL